MDCTESTDQRYVARNKGPTCDLGAFEFDSHATITVAYNQNATVDTKTGKVTVSGRAEPVRARALAALGSPTEARAAADRAVVALANGYGSANQHTRRARAFRDSLP